MKVCCPGFFDLIHPGHERFLVNLASEYASLDVVILEGGSHRLEAVRLTPIEAKDRIEQIMANSPDVSVTIVPMEEVVEWFRVNEAVNTIVVGDESALQSYHWLTAVEPILTKRSGGVKIYRESARGPFIQRRNPYIFPRSYDAESVYKHLLESRGTTVSSLCKKIEGTCKSSRVLVVGDLIADEYIQCSVGGISAEAPIPVMIENNRSVFVGGAGVIARHLKFLGCSVTLATSYGQGESAEAVQAQLNADGIHCFHLSDSGSMLIKSRYLSKSTKLFRVTRGDAYIPFDPDSFEQLLAQLPSFDLLFVADYGSLFQNETLISRLLQESHSLAIPVVSDVQARAPGTSVLNVPGAYVVMPTEREARLAVGLTEVGLEELGRMLMQKGSFRALGLTLDEDGLLVFDIDNQASVVYLPALNRDPVDVSGAGDCQLVVFAMSKFSGNDIVTSAVISSIAAGIAVSNLGNIPVSLNDIEECWNQREF
jgi:rfaE bifunctional protein kinase chain/domain